MICLICRQAETSDGYTSVSFARGEMKLVVTHVPARICPGCGEAYLEGFVAQRLLEYAEHKFIGGNLEEVEEYNSL